VEAHSWAKGIDLEVKCRVFYCPLLIGSEPCEAISESFRYAKVHNSPRGQSDAVFRIEKDIRGRRALQHPFALGFYLRRIDRPPRLKQLGLRKEPFPYLKSQQVNVN
jgi:hypothetical protein